MVENKINFAVVMCGGRASHFNGINKSLVMYDGRTMISYVLESLDNTPINNILFLANPNNYNEIKEEVDNYKLKNNSSKKYIIIKEPPKRFREVLLHLKDTLDENPVLIVAGNQPMKKDFLKRIINTVNENNCLAVTLYPKNNSNESIFTGISNDDFIQEGEEYALQHPCILSKEILKKQIEEDFKYKIEETIKNISKEKNEIKIKGIFAEMPPEFDNQEMLKTTFAYLDRVNMEVISLAGNHISSKDWLEKCKIELKDIFPNNTLHYYKHWTENQPVIDFDYEIEALRKEINLLIKPDKKLVVFAKSVGTLLIMKMIKDNLIHPEKCIFLGIPLHWALKYNFNIDEWIKDYSTPTLFMQNNKDPFCSSEELKNYLKEKNVQNSTLVESNGENHDYEDYDLIKESISCHLSSNKS